MIQHPKQQPDINRCDNYSSRWCTNIYYYCGRSVLGVYLTRGQIYSWKSRKHLKHNSRKYCRVEIWLICFLVRFHLVHQDGSDPGLGSITQRFSSECEPVPRGPSGCRKALSAGQS